MPTSVTIATNNGEVGGGEVMLLRIAAACVQLGVDVTVVAPSSPSGLADSAKQAGLRTVVLHADGRFEWMRALRRWDRHHRQGLLWCNGLVPSAATAGHPNRIMHLHQLPAGIPQRVLAQIARVGAREILVPSEWMRQHVRPSRVLTNWTRPIELRTPKEPSDPFTVGFLGRPSVDKGVPVLADALRMLDEREPGRYRLIVGGEPRFVSASDQRYVDDALATIAHLCEVRGWVDAEDLFAQIDLLVVPSVWGEPFGLVATEAMAAGVPVVVSDAGALPEVVGRDDGMLVTAGDSDALAATIQALAAGTHPAPVAAMRARWEERYSPDAGARRVGKLLDGLQD